jgi:hypothetical protein
MKFLLYAIVPSLEDHAPQILAGIDDWPVFFIQKDGVGAAVSKLENTVQAPDITHILTYQKVVETLHNKSSVIPMRYGCLFENEQQITKMLEDHGDEYRALLKELGDCVEMGIRILMPDINSSYSVRDGEEANLKETKPLTPGHEYLAALKARYGPDQQFAKEMIHVSLQCRTAFSGLYVKYKEEHTQPLKQQSTFQNIYSLFFLVPRETVASFHIAFQDLCRRQTYKLLLSGPWPPYNFVLPDNAHDSQGRSEVPPVV